MDAHVTNRISLANKKINILKAMACKEYGCDTGTLLRYVSACVLSVLEYGGIALNACSQS